MVFKLEAVYAFHGDSLLLHYGSDDPHPSLIMIDGGARGTYRNFLKPRLEELQDQWDVDTLPMKMIMVSHTDSDHIAGVLDLFKELKNNDGEPPICQAETLWHNAFDDVIGNDDEELISNLVADPGDVDHDERPDHEIEAVVASVKQGRDLRIDASTLAMNINHPFTKPDGTAGLVLAKNALIDQGEELTFQVLGPNEKLVAKYQEKWNKFLKDKGLAEAQAASFKDPSAFNLASIVVLAKLNNRTMLLTGDARGDFIVNGLVDAGLLEEESRYPLKEDHGRRWRAKVREAEAREITKPLHVDLMKMPHHGSANNVERGFFKRVTADHYLFSGNGNHHNPDPATLRMIAAARGDDKYTVHFTVAKDQHETERNDKFARALEELRHWVTDEKPDNCTVKYRGKHQRSITVDLSDDE